MQFHVELFREYCLKKDFVEECFPFDENTLVFKVAGKMFALSGLERVPFQINLKCDPDRSEELRERFPAVQGAYHMSKKHWNTILIDGTVPVKLILELIDHSYDLALNSLPKKTRAELGII
jgi:predicted DNA-binding protein (MmcQ/YjbR family)